MSGRSHSSNANAAIRRLPSRSHVHRHNCHDAGQHQARFSPQCTAPATARLLPPERISVGDAQFSQEAAKKWVRQRGALCKEPTYPGQVPGHSAMMETLGPRASHPPAGQPGGCGTPGRHRFTAASRSAASAMVVSAACRRSATPRRLSRHARDLRLPGALGAAAGETPALPGGGGPAAVLGARSARAARDRERIGVQDILAQDTLRLQPGGIDRNAGPESQRFGIVVRRYPALCLVREEIARRWRVRPNDAPEDRSAMREVYRLK
jgi:hypothetical protein